MFEVHKLNAAGMKKAEQLQSAFKQFLSGVEEICIDEGPPNGPGGPGGREMAIVRTKLEEASFFAKRAMAMQPENHDEVFDPIICSWARTKTT